MIETPNPIPDNCFFSGRRRRPSCAASCNSVTCRIAFGPADERPKITRTRALNSTGVVPEQGPAPRGTVRVTTVSGQRCVAVPFVKMKKRLTADGEVAMLGFVHNYLGVWAARADAGEVGRPGFGEFTYGWDGHTALELPVLDQDVKRVQAQVRAILARPETTQHISQAPAAEPRRGEEEGIKMARPAMTTLIDGKECVTVTEAAWMKGVSRQAILMRVKRGTLPHVQVGKQLFVPLEALKGWGWDASEPRGGEKE